MKTKLDSYYTNTALNETLIDKIQFQLIGQLSSKLDTTLFCKLLILKNDEVPQLNNNMINQLESQFLARQI